MPGASIFSVFAIGLERMATRWLTVGEDRLPGPDVLADGVGQRLQKRRDAAYPIREGGAPQVDPVAFEDLALTMQRQVIRVLRHQHVSQQPGAGTPPFDRARRKGGLHDPLAAGAGHSGADDPVHHEASGPILQLIGHVVAEPTERAATGPTGISRRQNLFFAGEMVRQR